MFDKIRIINWELYILKDNMLKSKTKMIFVIKLLWTEH